MEPYIGITDFMSFEQVQKMLTVFAKHLPADSNQKLHVGVMMSYKTLHNIPTKWQTAFPDKKTIASIFSSDQVYNCLHYVDYDDESDLWKSLDLAISYYGGIWIHSLQLDMIWPDPGQIANGLHTSRKQVEVILQIGKNALAESNDDPQEVVRRIGDYEGVIQRVLLDKSMGRGIGLDAQELLPFIRLIRKIFPDLGISVAGGLGPKSIHLLEPLLKEFPDLSFDAQGQLRPSGNALDPIDWDLAGEYLVKALQLVD